MVDFAALGSVLVVLEPPAETPEAGKPETAKPEATR
jgi:hypothetical protein